MGIPEEAAPGPGEEDSIVAKTRRAPALHLMIFLALTVVAALSAARAEYANPHGVAVIIGNKAYRNERVPEVAYAHRDAEAFRRFVLDVLGFNPDNLIDLRDATQAEMETAFGNERSQEGRVWSYLHPRHGSDVVVFYSGHGVPGLKDRRGYLLPVDADPDSAEINGYPIDLLYANLGGLDAAKSVRVFLDACFSGDSDRGMLVRSASPVYVQASLPEASGDKLTVLAASSGEEVASWDDEAKHGLFTHHLLDALYGAGDADGDGRVTAAEAKVYLDDTMTIAARREFRRQQNASLNGVSGTVLARAGAGGAFPPRPELDDSGAAGGAGEPPPPPPPPPETAKAVEEGLGLTHGERVMVQYGLLSLGHAIGLVDGAFGRRTRSGIEGYQRAKGLPETGYLTGELRDALKMLGEAHREDDAAREAERKRLAASRERRDRERQVEERRADDAAFGEAKRLHTPASYQAYLERGGRHEAEARALLSGVTKPKWEVGAKFRDCPGCPELVVVAAGSFDMGSPSYEGGRDDDEGPVHGVTLSESFAVGVYEVTRGEWGRFVSETGYESGGSCWTYEGGEWKDRTGRGWRNPGFSQSDVHPVVCVNWGDARAYVEWLSSEAGEGYRMLSESEWEYVARGGSSTSRYWGGSESGQCSHSNGADSTLKSGYRDWKWSSASCADGYVHTSPVGSFRANGFGLHDVMGNVWEWVEDCWHESYRGAPGDGSAWTSGGDCGSRVLRGGSWFSGPGSLRSAGRGRFATGDRSNGIGFRVSRTLD